VPSLLPSLTFRASPAVTWRQAQRIIRHSANDRSRSQPEQAKECSRHHRRRNRFRHSGPAHTHPRRRAEDFIDSRTGGPICITKLSGFIEIPKQTGILRRVSAGVQLKSDGDAIGAEKVTISACKAASRDGCSSSAAQRLRNVATGFNPSILHATHP
jgi:hypothetical protein